MLVNQFIVMEFIVELFIHYSCQSMSNRAVPIAFVMQGLWMNSSTLITLAIGPVSALRNYPLVNNNNFFPITVQVISNASGYLVRI